VGATTNKKNSLQKDTCELPNPTEISYGSFTTPTGVDATRYNKAMSVNVWNPTPPSTSGACATNYYFRRGVRLFNGEDLLVTPSGTNKLSATKGITMATENMVYIWGNYNTEGITGQPSTGSTLNDSALTDRYTGDQVPASIVADAFFPISKTWYDAMGALYPEGGTTRIADAGATNDYDTIGVTLETSVRTGIIAGQTLSSMPSSLGGYYLFRLNGGVHNYPRFLETWSPPGLGTWTDKRWNYVGSFIILYNSTQAVGPYGVVDSVIYNPPKRNWAFDDTFTIPAKLPPGTPMFQYIEPTAFRQVLAD
jgi:hypothetical protein